MPRQKPDDMGDDDQETEMELIEQYVDDPPEDMEISSSDEGEVGINAYVKMERKPGETDDSLDLDEDGEADSMHVSDEP